MNAVCNYVVKAGSRNAGLISADIIRIYRTTLEIDTLGCDLFPSILIVDTASAMRSS